MWSYDKRLQYPVKIKNPNPALAKVIVTQLGGPHGKKILFAVGQSADSYHKPA